MSAITTHILDLSTGTPAANVEVVLEVDEGEAQWRELGRGTTDDDGRLRSLPVGSPPTPGQYRLSFLTRAYFERAGLVSFYPYVVVTFEVTPAQDHYHVPLLLSPFGYSTYRGS